MFRHLWNNTAAFVARRFLRSPRSHSIINIMSWVSVVAVGVPVAAMVILMSVFNGFDAIVRDMHSDFEPEITVQASRGKTFVACDSLRDEVQSVDGVEAASYILEGEALLSCGGRRCTAMVRGVDCNFASTVPIEQMITGGDFVLNDVWGDHCVVGQGLAYELGLRSMWGDSLWMYAPSRGRYSKLMPMSGVNAKVATPSGIFALDADTDGRYVITSIEIAQGLLDYPNGASALKVRLKDAAQTEQVKAQIAQILPAGVEVRSRQELNESMYKVLDLEKLAVLLIGMMILIVASFSVVGTLIMLIIDKKESIETLRAMGADTGLVRSIFVRQGMAICMIGAVGGFVLGVVLSLVQQHFGVIRIPAESFLIESYPVQVVASDLIVIVAIFSVVSYVTTRLTVVGRIKTVNHIK